LANKKQAMPDDLITLTEAAELKGYADVSAVNHLIRRGRIQSFQFYGKTLVSRSEIECYQPAKPGPKPKDEKAKVSKKSDKK
jgi:hypothetical protein